MTTIIQQADDSTVLAIPAVIRQAANALAGAALSSATMRAYRSDFAAFATWCSAEGVQPVPAHVDSVCAFIAHDMARGRKAASISRSIAAISCAHEMADLPSPGKTRKVQDALKAMRRQIGTAKVQKDPATADIVANMLAACPDTLIGKRDRALLALGFAGAFRRSELVTLDVSDIRHVDGGALITIRRSKTDQAGAGQEIGILNGSRVRPLDAVADWLTAAGITDGPIFRNVTKAGAIGDNLSPERAAIIVKDAVKAMNLKAGLKLDPARFSGHSLRAGFITSGAENGVDALKIAETSRHKSLDVLRGYVRRANLLKDHAGSSFM